MINSCLYLFGQDPVFILVLIILAMGTLKIDAKFFRILAGISPGIVDLFVLIFSIYGFTCHGDNVGMESEENSGILISSFLTSL